MIIDVARKLTKSIKNNVKIDWTNQEQVKAEIRNGVRNILRKAEFPLDKIEKFVEEIVLQAEQNYTEV